MKTITSSGTVKKCEKFFCTSRFNLSLLSSPAPFLLDELKNTFASKQDKCVHCLFGSVPFVFVNACKNAEVVNFS